MLKFFILVFLTSLYSIVRAQPHSQVHFIEAQRLAETYNFETAFALIAIEAEKELNCHAIGNYWLWSLQYGKRINDSTYEFPTQKTEKKANFGKLFYYSFKGKMLLERSLEKCPNNGKINEAMGFRYYLQALEAPTQAIEEQIMAQSVFHFRRALRGGANDTLSNFYLGQGLEYTAKFGEAIRYYKRAYGIDDSHIQSLLKIAACFGKISEWDSCLTYAEKALLFESKPIEKATALRLKAEAMASKNNRKEAMKLFKESLKLVPGDYDNTLAFIDFLYPIKKAKACKQAVKLLGYNVYHRHIHIAYKYLFEGKDKSKVYKKVMKIYSTASNEYIHLNLKSD